MKRFQKNRGGSNNVSDDADEISLNKTYKGQIAFNDRSDWYKFTIPKTENIAFINIHAERKEEHEKSTKTDFNTFTDFHYGFISTSSSSGKPFCILGIL